MNAQPVRIKGIKYEVIEEDELPGPEDAEPVPFYTVMLDEHERKRIAERRYAQRNRERLNEAKQGGREKDDNAQCHPDRCIYYAQCENSVWTGALLPCQPKNQTPVIAARERGERLINMPAKHEVMA